jgi:16S rRNA (uracil1498-N3)-methyltransferase
MIPDVVRPQPLAALLEDAKNAGDVAILCAERSGAQPLSALLASGSLTEGTPSLVVLIGPEGGFSENEFMIAGKLGVIQVSLGKRILRSETAAVYASALLISHFDR